MAAGGLANLTALIALVFSGYSFYETVLKRDALRLFVPPTIGFADPSNGPFDVYEIPITVANQGARAGVALAMDLTVTNAETGETKRYYAAGLGAWRDAFGGAMSPFAPISVEGREAVTRQVLFYPRDGETVDRLVAVEGGVYEFQLEVQRAAVERLPLELDAGDAPSVLSFQMTVDSLDYRRFDGGGTVRFRSADYAPIVSE